MAKSTLIYTGVRNVGEATIAYEVRAERRSATRYSLTPLKAYLRVPKQLSKPQLLSSIKDFEAWIDAAIRKRPDLAIAHLTTTYAHGDVWWLGEFGYRLHIKESTAKGASAKTKTAPDVEGISGAVIKIPSGWAEDQQAVATEKLLYRMVAKQAAPQVEALLDRINDAHFQVDVHRVKLSPTTSRWGSCSSTGAISISSRLLAAPELALQAVLVHELAHRIEMNHSARFWKLVHDAMPEYKVWHQWLRKNGGGLGWRKAE